MKPAQLLIILLVTSIYTSCRNDEGCDGYVIGTELRQKYKLYNTINDSNDVWFSEVADTNYFINNGNTKSFITSAPFFDTVGYQINQQPIEDECTDITLVDSVFIQNKVIPSTSQQTPFTIEYVITKQVVNWQGKTDNNPNEFRDDFYVLVDGQKFGFNHLSYPPLQGVILGGKHLMMCI